MISHGLVVDFKLKPRQVKKALDNHGHDPENVLKKILQAEQEYGNAMKDKGLLLIESLDRD